VKAPTTEQILAGLARAWLQEAARARAWHLRDVRGWVPRMSVAEASGLLRDAEAALGERVLADLLDGEGP
jgi:hypothetical protein